MTHTQPWGSSHSSWVKSWIKSSFLFILIFPWWVTVFLFFTHFLFDLSSDSSCCSEKEISGIFLYHWWGIALLISEMLLSHSGFRSIKEAVLPQWQDDQVRFFQLSYFQQDLKLNSLDTASVFVSNFYQVLTTWLHHQSVPNYVIILGQHKVQRKKFLQEICWI